MVKKNNRIWCGCLMIFAVCGLFSPGRTSAAQKEIVAVLPFKVYALEPLDHLKRGLQDMLCFRLTTRGFDVINPKRVNMHPLAFVSELETKDFYRIGADLKADWVIAGSATQIGKKISIDVNVVDMSPERRRFLIFMVADDVQALVDTADKLAASIENQIRGVVMVDKVQVKGNVRVEAEAILAVIETKAGDKLDADQLDKDLRSVYQMGYFNDVEIQTEDGPKGKMVTFLVDEKSSIGEIVFLGNKDVDEEDLKKEVGIQPFSILDENEVRRSVDRLREYYHQKGYYNVEIKDEIEPMDNNQVRLAYDIKENEKVYIRKIEFVGNSHFDDDELKDIMVTSEKGFLSWITDSGKLDKKKLEFDAHKIASFYHNHGFIKAKVGEPKVTFDKDIGLIITIEIQEGEQFGVGSVTVDGELIEPASVLLSKVKIGEEKVFNRERVRRDVQTLKEIYADTGFAYAEVVPLVKEDDATHKVDIAYTITKGQKVRFERINITGNTITRDKVIRRELTVAEGDYFSGKALKLGTERLHRLGFFEDVEVQTKKGSADDQMVLDVNVKEKPTGSFSFGAGYSSVDKVIGTAQVEQKNLFGRGQRLMAAIRIGGNTNQFDVSFTEPWLFDRPLSGTVQLYRWEREFTEYTKNSYGGLLSLGFPLRMIDSYTRGWTQYRYEDADVTDVADNAAFEIKDMEGRAVTSAASVGVKRNTTDRPWNTTRGSVNSLSFEYAGGVFQGDNYFYKSLAQSAWFYPMFWDTVFMVQGRWGYVDKMSGGDLPVYEKFYLGGINTVRGFKFGDISPRDPDTNDKVGGEIMMCYNVEYRFPLIKAQGVVGLVFFDAGNVYSTESNVIERDFATSVGAGVRWYSPMGPLRLEWGYNLNPQFNEDSSQLEFSVGTMF